MDPNAALQEMRGFAREARQGNAPHTNERELRWMFEDLDHWLTTGGFLPDDWDHPITGEKLTRTVRTDPQGIEDFESNDYLAVLAYLIEQADWVFSTTEANKHLYEAFRILVQGKV